MVEPDRTMPNDVFSTAPTPNPDQHEAIKKALPLKEHDLEAQSQELDEAFWRKVDSLTEDVDGEAASNEWKNIKAWVDKFDQRYKQAYITMAKPAADEKHPFAEKYEAREIFESLLKQILDDWLEESVVVKVIKACLLTKLGINYYDAEEISESYRKHEEALKLWKIIPKEF